MRILELLTEAREAPLYHFTLESNFFRILASDTLISPSGKIYFTRDYSRQFSPSDILKGTWGFRVDQELLHQKYGKQLQAGGQEKPWDEKRRQAWLADPKNKPYIDAVNAGKQVGNVIDGAAITDIVRGTIRQSSRWESEEHLNIDKIPNFHNYITGIVYAGGKSVDPMRGSLGGKLVNTGSRSARPQDSLDELALLLMGHFKGDAGFAQRDALIDYMTEHNIPLVYQRQDFPAKAVKQRMIEKWRERKAERTRREQEDQTSWIFINNPQGGGVTSKGPSNPLKAARQAMQDLPHKFPNGMYGLRKISDRTPTWFLNIYTSDVLPYPPNMAMVPIDNPPTTYSSLSKRIS